MIKSRDHRDRMMKKNNWKIIETKDKCAHRLGTVLFALTKQKTFDYRSDFQLLERKHG